MNAQEKIAAYHAMRPPRDLAEHLTAAELLGLPLDVRGPDRTTLRERLAAYWGAAPAAAPGKQRRGPARIPDDVIRRNAGSAKEYAP
jgi:hypothetical protein